MLDFAKNASISPKTRRFRQKRVDFVELCFPISLERRIVSFGVLRIGDAIWNLDLFDSQKNQPSKKIKLMEQTKSNDIPFLMNVDDVLSMKKEELLENLRRLHEEYLHAISKKSKLANLQAHVITMAHKVNVVKQRNA